MHRHRRGKWIHVIASDLSPLDLLRAWDSRKDGNFSKKDFLRMMKRIVDDMQLWDDCVRDVVVETFNLLVKHVSEAQRITILGSALPIDELQKFLQTGWAEHKQSLAGGGGAQPVRRKPPPPVAKPPPVYGDPRWPHRVWPARKGSTSCRT